MRKKDYIFIADTIVHLANAHSVDKIANEIRRVVKYLSQFESFDSIEFTEYIWNKINPT